VSRVVDTLGRPVAEGGILITLRPDLPGGVSLGGDATIEPGETKRVPASIAMQLLHTRRAVRAEPPTPAPKPAESPAPAEPSPAADASSTARKRK